MNTILTQLQALRIIPVIAIDNAEDADPMADALSAGGLPVAEITFRTAAAESAIRRLAKREGFLIGAGTVLNVETAQRAVDAGAKFLVSPGFSPKVVGWCAKNNLPITPGVATPTEIEMALDHGLSAVKFFPAETIGGLKALKAIAAPYAMVRFIPTGGITAENLAHYLAFSPVLACGGSWMATKQMLSAGQFERVRELTAEAVKISERAIPAT
ncbi:MAG TPA: bifunctional 4-hydroxy-2-oxoglutarate aldolase/2-dehydro-3-deoxy-phosphogluconate aldolase [Tepidisphaeraceae bacterium]|nr:bifunctional 4-hydroxy-2-oxoglutarate aldolase/2-dehydro-3-deoxy-phosphogluconate aldolase [Tepidisphaeraceae bacterium]